MLASINIFSGTNPSKVTVDVNNAMIDLRDHAMRAKLKLPDFVVEVTPTYDPSSGMAIITAVLYVHVEE